MKSYIGRERLNSIFFPLVQQELGNNHDHRENPFVVLSDHINHVLSLPPDMLIALSNYNLKEPDIRKILQDAIEDLDDDNRGIIVPESFALSDPYRSPFLSACCYVSYIRGQDNKIRRCLSPVLVINYSALHDLIDYGNEWPKRESDTVNAVIEMYILFGKILKRRNGVMVIPYYEYKKSYEQEKVVRQDAYTIKYGIIRKVDIDKLEKLIDK